MTDRLSTIAGETAPIATDAVDTFDRGLIEGPLVPTLIRFSLPLIGTNLLHSIAGAYTAAWVGQTIGPDGLTGVVIVNVLVWMMLMATVMGVASASSIMIAQAYGANRSDHLKVIASTSVAFVVAGSVVLAALGWNFSPLLVDLISTPEQAKALTIEYLQATCFALLAVFPFVFITVMIRGTGDARTPFWFTALWLSLSFLLIPVMLTGAFGLPKFGLAAVAYANLVAALIALVAMLIFTWVSKHPITLFISDRAYWLPDVSIFRLLLLRGMPMGLEGILISGVYLALLSMVNQYGAATSAAYAASTQLWGFIQMPIGAFASSVAAIASQNIGAGRWDRVDQLALRGCLLSGGVATFGVLAIYAAGNALFSIFLPDGGESLAMALRINLLVLWSWIPLAVTMVLFGIVRANGAMVPPTLIMVGTLWLVRIPFANYVQPYLGADAIWWSFPVGTISCAALSFLYFKYGKWREKTLMGDYN